MNRPPHSILLIESEVSDPPPTRAIAENLNGFVVKRQLLNGDEPANFFAGETFSAILLNVATFESQLALLHRVHETVPHLPILVFADEGDAEKAAQILQAGAQDYLIKSWLQNEGLPWVIQNAIERQQIWTNLQKKNLVAEADQRQLQTLIQKNADGILIVNQKGQVQFANPAAERLFDMNAPQLLGMDFGFPVVSDDTIEIDIWQRGQPRFAEMRVVDITLQGENVFLVSLRDVTERVLTERRMRYLATHDALTDLPNRILFFDRLAHALAQASRQKVHVAVFFLDVDKFKQINDTYGHQVGDQILQALAFRLQDCLRKSDTVARMGGDEFTVILENIEKPMDCVAVAKKVLEVVNTPFGIKKQEFYLTASLGISIFPDDGEDGDILLNHADTAMYKAKESRGRFYFFNPAFNS
ncbi:MAG TPA: diguanylate cyclase [Anaerolineales bacterium]|nr:diguanylate cyclase [Anaerolineales bacterium]